MRTLLLLLLFPCVLVAQKIDNVVSFRDIRSDSYFRFHYDNDYFASRDRDYTQGYNFELVLPWLEKNPINHVLLKPKNMFVKHGLSVEHVGYAPNNIKSPDIQFGDRPFAAAIVLKSFSIAIDTLHQTRISSGLSLGMIGPAAFGKEMQEGIHSATGNTKPEGWKNQIKNDVVLNYEIILEKQLFRYNDIFALSTNGTARAGTLFTNASIGINAVIGILNSPFSGLDKKRKYSIYMYAQPVATVVGYDATLQGGLFNDESPYTIESSKVKRFTAQNQFGIVFQTKTMYFEYTRTAITKEFEDGIPAKWGGVRIGFTF